MNYFTTRLESKPEGSNWVLVDILHLTPMPVGCLVREHAKRNLDSLKYFHNDDMTRWRIEVKKPGMDWKFYNFRELGIPHPGLFGEWLAGGGGKFYWWQGLPLGPENGPETLQEYVERTDARIAELEKKLSLDEFQRQYIEEAAQKLNDYLGWRVE